MGFRLAEPRLASEDPPAQTPSAVPKLEDCLSFLCVPFVSAACSNQPIVIVRGETEPRVELGTGEAEFEPIEGEPTLEMAAGSQGGFHVWASLEAYGFEEERLDVELRTTVVGEDDSTLIMRPTLRGEQIENEDGETKWFFAGYPAQIDRARCRDGKRVHLEVTLSDSEGREASDERYCIVSLAEEYRSNCE